MYNLCKLYDSIIYLTTNISVLYFQQQFTVLIDLYHRVLVLNLIGYIVRFKKFFPLEGILLQIMLRYY